jgi:hypothetical protein
MEAVPVRSPVSVWSPNLQGSTLLVGCVITELRSVFLFPQPGEPGEQMARHQLQRGFVASQILLHAAWVILTIRPGYCMIAPMFSRVLLTCSLAAGVMFARDPWIGTWTEDMKKSQPAPADQQISYEQQPDGTIRESRGQGAAAIVTTFRVDGKPYPSAGGDGTTTWVQQDPHTIVSTLHRGGKPVVKRTRVLSPDGKTLTLTIERYVDGKKDTTTTTYMRTSGQGKGQGLLGSWRGTKVVRSTPSAVTFTDQPDGTLRSTNNVGSTFAARFDDKPYPVTGPGILPDITVKLRRKNAQEFQIEYYRNNSVVVTSTVSVQGNTLTLTSRTAGSTAEPSVLVFDRQQ